MIAIPKSKLCIHGIKRNREKGEPGLRDEEPATCAEEGRAPPTPAPCSPHLAPSVPPAPPGPTTGGAGCGDFPQKTKQSTSSYKPRLQHFQEDSLLQ